MLGGDHTIPAPVFEALAETTEGNFGIIDYDCLDAALAPGQRYPDVAGITTREMSLALRTIAQSKKIYGYDICCMSPRYDVQHIGCQFVARSILEMMSGIASNK